MVIKNKTWAILEKAVQDQDLISKNIIDNYEWNVVIIDDNCVADDEIGNLNLALKDMDVLEYYSVPTNEISLGTGGKNLKKYFSEDDSLCGFFEFDANGHADYLEHCIFFSDPISFLLLRTGDVRHTIYAGSKKFLNLATGIDVEDNYAISIGSYWPDNRIESIYKPLNRILF